MGYVGLCRVIQGCIRIIQGAYGLFAKLSPPLVINSSTGPDIGGYHSGTLI